MRAIARPGAACLFALALLTACATEPEVVYRTEVREVPVVEYREIPEELTAPMVLPPWPDRELYNRDLPAWIEGAKAVIRAGNSQLEQIRQLNSGDDP